MEGLIAYLADINAVSICLRVALSMICGGVIGIERSRAHQVAGMRTYMLVCLGATVVMLTGQYMQNYFGTGCTGDKWHWISGCWRYYFKQRKDQGIDHSGGTLGISLHWIKYWHRVLCCRDRFYNSSIFDFIKI